jgi:hypothetical protein
MSDLELGLLEMWTADAEIYRNRRDGFYRMDEARTRCVDDGDIGIPSTKQKTFDKTCMQCGRDFKARRHDKKYCSNLCLKLADQQRERQREREERIRLGLRVRAVRVQGYWQTLEAPDSIK